MKVESVRAWQKKFLLTVNVVLMCKENVAEALKIKNE
jgi:hypothetical protein